MLEDKVGMAAVVLDLEGYKVLDIGDEKIGVVEGSCEDRTGTTTFISVKTGWLGIGRSHFVPIRKADINESEKLIRVPFPRDMVKHSPDFKSKESLDANGEAKVVSYYGLHGETFGTESNLRETLKEKAESFKESSREKMDEAHDTYEEGKEKL